MAEETPDSMNGSSLGTAAPSPKDSEVDYRSRLMVILLGIAAFRVLYIALGPFDISPDEAHYWDWSRHLGISYYSKGPVVAYVIAVFTSIFGDTDFGVRIGAVTFSFLASIILYQLSLEVTEGLLEDKGRAERVAFWSALIPNMTLILGLGSILMTTDVLLIFFWAAALLCLYRGISREEGYSRWWYLSGVMVGVGFLAKYTMLLIVPSILLFLICVGGERRWLLRKEPYITGLVSLIFASPVIVWNILNGQVTIRHTAGQAHVGAGHGGLQYKDFFEFFGAQVGLLTPVIFFGVAYGIYWTFREGRRRRDSGLLLLVYASMPMLLFFLFKALHGKVQANWAGAAYVTTFTACALAWTVLFDSGGDGLRRWIKRGVVFGFALGLGATLAVYFPQSLEAVGVKDAILKAPFNRVTGWRVLGEKVGEVKELVSLGGEEPFIFSNTYQLTSLLAFYVPGNPAVYNVDTGRRRLNQYDLWSGLYPNPVESQGEDGRGGSADYISPLTGKSGIYIKAGLGAVDPIVEEAFSGVCIREVFEAKLGERHIKDFGIFRCSSFSGISRPDLPLRY